MSAPLQTPFDQGRMDTAMAAAGIDLVLATSRHNVRYLLGGYVNRFFASMDAIGLSRYSPLVGYIAGSPDKAFFIGAPSDAAQWQVDRVWLADARGISHSTEETAALASDAIIDRGLGTARIALEPAFCPMDMFMIFKAKLPDARFTDGTRLLEHLRAVKMPHEIDLLRQAADGIVQAMLSTFALVRPGSTTLQTAHTLETQVRSRGLGFDYARVAAGRSVNREPSSTRLEVGGTLSLDSGGNVEGYIGDLARMSVDGDPSPTQRELLAEIDMVQLAARDAVRGGRQGNAIYDAAGRALTECRHAPVMDFVAHGMGLVSHEAPRLAKWSNPIGYPVDHLEAALEPGMVLSIETTVSTAEFGFVKLEDTVLVTNAGCDGMGDGGRGWNPIGG